MYTRRSRAQGRRRCLLASAPNFSVAWRRVKKFPTLLLIFLLLSIR